MVRTFASDNNSGVHPQVWRAMGKANRGHVGGYGDDAYTLRAANTLKGHLGPCDVFFVLNGTGGNVVGLQALLPISYGAVICAKRAHINVDECGAAERYIGCKLIGIDTPDGKLTPELIQANLPHRGDVHQVQAKAISLTNPTEFGTVYTLEELYAISRYAHRMELKIHIDGARLTNAAAHLDVSLEALTSGVGADVVTLGGTKGGGMLGEAVIVFDRQIACSLGYIRKQAGQLASKMRFISAQFEALFGTDLWLKIARHTNERAALLGQKLTRIPGVELTQPVQTNAVFARLPHHIQEQLEFLPSGQRMFYPWREEEGEARFVCSFDTTVEDINRLVRSIRELM